ncbi:histidine kinase [bacterium SCSIO 12643]|nr:histidine kinase [bacterium SCSIO 12643]
MKIKWTFTILFLTLIQIGKSQPIPESVNYINYTLTDGLPSNETYDVFQDSKGYLWIGTDNGVVKYDGHTFKTYTTKDGLTDNTIFRIQEDYKGRIWFMTYRRNLCFYEKNEFHTFKYNEKLQEATQNLDLTYTITDFHLDFNENLKLTFVNLLNMQIDSNGNITSESIKSIRYLPQITPKIEATLDKLMNEINSNKSIINTEKWGKLHILKTSESTYISYQKNLFTWDKINHRLITFPFYYQTVTGICSDFENGIWISTLSNGIFYVPSSHLNQFEINILENEHLYGIVPQSDNMIFSYGQDSHFYELRHPYSQLTTYSKNLDFRAIPDKYLVKGLKFENPIYVNQHLNTPNTIIKLSPTITLLGSIQGIIKVLEGKPKKVANHKVIQINSWTTKIGSQFYDHYYNITWQLFPYNISSNRIFKFYRTNKNQILLATTNGILEFNPTNNNILEIESLKALKNYRIQDIIETKNNTLFFATKANGIFTLKDSIINSIDLDSGLLSNTVNQLVYDSIKNQIWVGTNNGISVLNQNTKYEWVPRSIITKHDGLGLTDIRQLIFYDEYLLFANNEGIGKIHKSHLDDTLPPPILHIQSLLSNEHSKNIDSTINLTHDSNNIQINYHAISYKSQNDIIYKYQLSPINDSWQTTTNDNIIFNALPPDDYTLKLKAINIDGVESEIQTLQFSVIPAFWMTWWFKAIVIIIAIIFGYKLSIRTIKIYKTQAQFQKTINEMQIISLQSKMNPHFIFNSLNSIQNYILKNEKTNANQYLLEFSKLIRTILQNSDSTTILLQDELETLKMYVNLEKKRIRKEFKYTEEIDSEIDLEKCIIPSLLIQPYIENAIWHGKVYSNPNGEIKLSIHKKQNTLFIEICDNGIGIKNAEASKVKKTQHKSLGTSVTKKRIELLSELNNEMSDVTISEAFRNEKVFVGTKIIFNIPYVLKYNS